MFFITANPLLRLFSLIAICIFTLLSTPTTHAANIIQEHLKIPAQIDGTIYNLEAMLYRPNNNSVYPLILLNHGRSTKPEERKSPTLVNYYKTQAETLAQKGFVVIVPVRRGYGLSEGPDAEYSTAATIVKAGLEGAKDITEVVKFMQKQPYIDKNTVLFLGQSCGGLVSIAATTKNIPGLVGVVNFAGGLRHTSKTDPSTWTMDDESALFKTYESYGKKATIPTLWIYTENDHYFPAALSPKMCDAFINGGGTAKFYLLPPFSKDGHTFFPSKVNIPIWMPLFDDFLNTLHIPTYNK